MHFFRRAAFLPALLASVAIGAAMAGAQSPSFTTITGEIGPGSLYEIAMPTAPWNGELVLFAHGIGNPGSPIALPVIGPLRDALTANGFAVAYSSFSVHGYAAVKDGAQRTHQLRGVFAATVGEPARVYLIGRSLGGLIAVGLVERFPAQYDGAVAGCGLVGGGAAELQYVADARVLFEYFFPGVIPGSPLSLPPDANVPAIVTAVRNALIAGLTSPGQPTLQFASTAQLPAIGYTEIVTAGTQVIGFVLTHVNNLMEVTHSHVPYDNTGVTYTGSSDDSALNVGVARYVADPSAANYLQHYYTPTGDLRVPVITLHTTRDPIVPMLIHEPRYAEAAQNAGASSLLLQRTVDAFGHCAFGGSATETTAFFDLVQWVRTGVKPLD